MPLVRSLEDLKKFREDALARQKFKTKEGKAQIIVGMGTCGVAAGARDTMNAILDTIEEHSLRGIVVSQTGCIGLCEKEPIVQVVVDDQPGITYAKVTVEVARQILNEHILGGKVLESHVIPL
jgi:(2Fe-2S) ferredoxin